MIYYGNGIIEFDALHNSCAIEINYYGKAIFFKLNDAYTVKLLTRKKLIIIPSKKIISTHIIKYYGEFRPYKAIKILDKSLISLKAIGLSYWQYSDGEWAYDTIEWQNDKDTYTHLKSLVKKRNIRSRKVY